MAKIINSPSDQLQTQNKLDKSLALQSMDNIPEERIDSTENQGNTMDLENFYCGNKDMLFSTGVLLTNMYRVYLQINEDEGVTKKKKD